MDARKESRLAALIVLFLGCTAFGQWVEQSFQLEEGWNSIFLEVEPAPRTADDLFAGQPIETVWARPLKPLVGFGPDCDSQTDPDCVAPHDTMWRVWFPPGVAPEEVKTLRVVEGGRVYTIKATQSMTLTIVGRPSGFTRKWRSGFNLVGFYVNPSSPPTFQSYLAPAGLLSGNTVYTIQPSGAIAPVAASGLVTPGKGYWVGSNTDVAYGGPLSIDFGTQNGVEFGKRQLAHTIEMKNLASAPRDVTVMSIPSAPVPNAPEALAANAGAVPLHRLDYGAGDQIENILQWSPLSSFTVSVAPDGMTTPPTTLDIGVRRAGLTEAVLDVEGLGSAYQGVLQISDSGGFRRFVGVTTEALPTAGGAAAAGEGEIMPRPGLYLGFVTVNRVSWVTAGARVWTNDDPDNPEFAGLLRCFGGDNADGVCFPDRRLCVGTPEIELSSIVCEDGFDCPSGGACAVITDCPGGTCNGFCIGGSGPGGPCMGSDDCPGVEGNEGVCSGDLDRSAARPTPAAFEFPVIIHLSDDDHLNQYTMLTEVSLLKDDENALVLATPDCDPMLCDDLVGALYVNGANFARRVSTAAFAFPHDLPFDAGGGFSTFLAASTTLAADDPLNPFLHAFHPDHDCVDADGNPTPGECFEINRSFVFSFESEPPDGQSELDWGDSALGGVYTEQVSGLHREPIAAQGRFELRRVSDLGALNTPIAGGIKK